MKKKILVVSDSHGDRKILEEIYEKYQNKVDFFFHNGDSELKPNDQLWQNFFVVGGNVDCSGFKNEQTIKIGMDTFFQTHGHLYNVSFSLQNLISAALENQVDIVLFGHLHKIICEKRKGILLVNPGSILNPRGDLKIKSYAILSLEAKKISVQYYRREHSEIYELNFNFMR